MALRFASLAAAAASAAIVFAASGAAAAAESKEKILRPTGLAPEHAEANLVLIDVLVRDRQGRPIPGLDKDDFDLLIDRLPAPIASFESACAPQAAAAPGAAAPAAPAPGAATTATAAVAPRDVRHVVIFFDIAHLTKQGRDHSIDAALKYVREGLGEGDRVMLLAMKGRPILLESFTSDRDKLAARLEAMKSDNDMLDMSVIEEKLNLADILRKECPPQMSDSITPCQNRVNAAVVYATAEEAKARRSLQALKSLMPALAAIRGRKSLVYFSETLRDEPGLEYLMLARTTSAAQGLSIKATMQDLHEAANAAGVSFYPVFAAGLGEGSGTHASDASISGISSQEVGLLAQAGQVGEDGALAIDTTMALETGGEALKRSNDLGKIFTSVTADMSCYYVIGYANPGPGDGKRHSIIVKAKTRGYEIRHRPYYEDLSETTRLDMKFQSAMMAPAYYREIAATVEAFQLAPTAKGLPFLFKVEFPLDEVTLVGQADGRRAGEVEVRAAVWTGPNETCRFKRRFPVTLDPGESTAGRKIIYEAGCEVPPGTHDVTAAVLDGPSWEIGGAEATLPVRPRAPGIAGDVVLWTSSGDDILVAGDAAPVGIQETGAGHGFVPRPERRFGAREAALLYVAVCPPGGAAPASGATEVARSIISGDTVLAALPPVTLGDAASPASGGCEGIFAKIPPGQFPAGRYTYQVKITGLAADPVIRRVGFAVEAATTIKAGETRSEP